MIPLMLVLFIATLDQTIVAASLPTIARAIGNSDQITWVTTAYLLTSAVTTLIFGKLGDLFGRKAILQIALGIFLIGSLFREFLIISGFSSLLAPFKELAEVV